MKLLAKEECKTNKDCAEYILQHFPVARDDNYEFWLIYLEEFHSLRSIIGHEAFMRFRDLITNKRVLGIDSLVKPKSDFQKAGQYWGESLLAKKRVEEMKAAQWNKDSESPQ